MGFGQRNKGLSLGTKMIISFSVLIVFMVANMVTSFVMSTKMNNKVQAVKSQDMKFSVDAQTANMDFMTDDANMLYLTGIPASTPTATVKTIVQAVNGVQSGLLSSLKDLQSNKFSLTPSEAKDAANAVKAANAYVTLVGHVEQIDKTDHKQANNITFDSSAETNVFVTLENALTKLSSDAQTRLTNSAQQTINFGREENLVVGIVGILGVVLALLGAGYANRALKPLQLVVKRLQKVSYGDFTGDDVVVKSYDEVRQIADATNAMKHSLREVIQNVGLHVDQVAASSQELVSSAEETTSATQHIALTIQEVATGSDQQAESAQIGTEITQEMAQGIQHIAATSQSVTAMALDTSKAASQGQESIQSVVLQMNNIHSTMTGLADSVSKLGDRSQQIGEIIKVITDIASRTNLLSLNASIEAARAGESGRGFAVVADEIRKLADQSSQSAQAIIQLVNGIQSDTEQAVAATSSASDAVSAGIQAVSHAGRAFDTIQTSVTDVADHIQEVSVAVQQVSANSDEVSQSIAQIANVAMSTAASTQNVSAATEEQLASMEEVTASVNELSKMAEELQDVIGKFVV